MTEEQIKQAGDYRRELYEYLAAEGFEMNEERHAKIRHLMKMSSNATMDEKVQQIGRLSSTIGLYKERFGDLEPGKKAKRRAQQPPPPQKPTDTVEITPTTTAIEEIKRAPQIKEGDEYHSPKSYGCTNTSKNASYPRKRSQSLDTRSNSSEYQSYV